MRLPRRAGRCGTRLIRKGTRSVTSWRLSLRMERFEECDESGRLRRAEVFTVGGHVSAPLDNLADELVPGLHNGHRIECRAAFAANLTERMAVAALLQLKHQHALPFERAAILQKLFGNRIPAPGVHDWTPGRVTRKAGECSEYDSNQGDAENGDRPATPAFFPFTRKKRKQQKKRDCNHRTDEKGRRFHLWRKQRKQSIEPEEEIVGPWSGLNDRRIGSS